jgi:hypothetical protein
MKVKKKKRIGFRWPDAAAPRESATWTFTRDGLSPSYADLFMNCREQFRLRTAEGWQSVTYDFYTEYGSIWHWMHARRAKRNEDVDFHKLSREYRKTGYKGPRDPASLAEQEIGYAMTSALWPVYQETYPDDLDREWVDLETPVSVRYEFQPNFWTMLRGMRDGSWRERGLNLHEMKTRGVVDQRGIQESLHLNTQVMWYLLLLKLQYPKEKVVGCEYDVIRRPGSRPRKNESVPEYVKRLRKEAERDPDHYFCRPRLDVTPEDIEHWRVSVLQPLLIEVYRWTQYKTMHFVNAGYLVPRPYASEMAGLICTGSDHGLVRGNPFAHHGVE